MKTRTGIPAGAVLASGLSRHGRSCHCRYCAEHAVEKPRIVQPEPAWSPYRDPFGFGPVREFWSGIDNLTARTGKGE